MKNLEKILVLIIYVLCINSCTDSTNHNLQEIKGRLNGLWCTGELPKLFWEDSITILKQKNITYRFDTLNGVKKFDWTLCVYGDKFETYKESLQMRGVSVRSTTEPVVFNIYKGTYQLLPDNRIRMAYAQKVEVKFIGSFIWGQINRYERKYIPIPILYDTLECLIKDTNNLTIKNTYKDYFYKLGYSHSISTFTENL